MADEPDTRGVEPLSDEELEKWRRHKYPSASGITDSFIATIDAEVVKRREAEEELAGWIDNARTFSAENDELEAEVARLHAALERIRDALRYRPVLAREIEGAFNIAAAALDKEGEADAANAD